MARPRAMFLTCTGQPSASNSQPVSYELTSPILYHLTISPLSKQTTNIKVIKIRTSKGGS